MKKKVVITGAGLVTPLGNSIAETWSALKSGKSGLATIKKFRTEGFSARVAGEVKNIDSRVLLKKYGVGEIQGRAPEYIQLLSAVDEAMMSANMCVSRNDMICLGSGGINKLSLPKMAAILNRYDTCCDEGLNCFFSDLDSTCRDFFHLGKERNGLSLFLSRLLGLSNIPKDIHVACATGAQVVANGYDLIMTGQASRVICCTIQALDWWKYIGFSLLDAMADCTGEPSTASRPFSKNRNGLVMAEGSACIILEDLEYAEKRQTPKILAEVAGHGVTTDAYRLTDPHPDAIYASKAMEIALRNAGVRAEEVDYINAHGTSTVENDRVETRAIKKVFGNNSYNILINATKSMTGHMLASSGLVETIVTALSLHEGVLHPTINLEEADKECDLNYLPGHKEIKAPIITALSNSFGFGGHNISLVLKKIG